MEKLYDRDFFDRHRAGAQRSARQIVPRLVELIQPRSVVDIGCGTGTWLAVFREHGVEEIFGVDGGDVNPADLDIAPEQFLAWDLSEPLELHRTFDLVVSLEVAEHLPAAVADEFVVTLTRLGKVVLFSAAIPGQRGEGHVNEQWPEYWDERFRARGYHVVDAIRPHVWHDPSVEVWYAQNSLLFVEHEHLQSHEGLRRESERHRPHVVGAVHPTLFLEARQKEAEAQRAYEWYSRETEMLKAQTHELRARVDALRDDAERYRQDAERHRQDVDHQRLEVERYRQDAERQRADAERYLIEVEADRALVAEERRRAEQYLAQADPRNVSLTRILRALPTILRRSWRKQVAKLRR